MDSNLARFVFLKHPFWDFPFCLITGDLSYSKTKFPLAWDRISKLVFQGFAYNSPHRIALDKDLINIFLKYFTDGRFFSVWFSCLTDAKNESKLAKWKEFSKPKQTLAYILKLMGYGDSVSYRWQQRDSNSQPLSLLTKTQPFSQTGQRDSLAKWLSAPLRTKWFWVRIPLLALKFQISHLFWARDSLTFRQLWSVDPSLVFR